MSDFKKPVFAVAVLAIFAIGMVNRDTSIHRIEVDLNPTKLLSCTDDKDPRKTMEFAHILGLPWTTYQGRPFSCMPVSHWDVLGPGQSVSIPIGKPIQTKIKFRRDGFFAVPAGARYGQ